MRPVNLVKHALATRCGRLKEFGDNDSPRGVGCRNWKPSKCGLWSWAFGSRAKAAPASKPGVHFAQKIRAGVRSTLQSRPPASITVRLSLSPGTVIDKPCERQHGWCGCSDHTQTGPIVFIVLIVVSVVAVVIRLRPPSPSSFVSIVAFRLHRRSSSSVVLLIAAIVLAVLVMTRHHSYWTCCSNLVRQVAKSFRPGSEFRFSSNNDGRCLR